MKDQSSRKTPIIALLTDFGTRDYFVAAIKGAIFSICRNAEIVDVTHDIEPQNIAAASFTLRACYRNFPEKTIFIAVVDPGVGSRRKAILVETKDYYFIAPDNGLLSFIFSETSDFKVLELTNEKFFAENVSRTFHGRDVFAPVAAHLANGVAPNLFGEETKDFLVLQETTPRCISENEIEAAVIHTDRFGNLITNLKPEDLPEKFTLEIGGTKIDKLQTFFAEAAPGELFMIFGSAGFLEIVAFQDSAQKLLSSKTGNPVKIKKL